MNIWEKIDRKRIGQAFEYYLYLLPFSLANKDKDQLNNGSIISIFATPRGGSTWLSNILRQIPGSTLIWEPLFRHPSYKINILNPFAYPHVRDLGFWWNQHIPENAEWPEAERFFTKLFNREIVNLKLYRYNKLKNVPNSEIFIFKFCFGNLMLPWLVNRFEIKPIFLIRHPCAVVASQLNYGAFSYMKKSPVINVPRWAKFYEYYLPFEEILKTVQTPEESLAVRWALTNQYLLHHSKNNRAWLTIAYESLLLNPIEELKRIENWIERPLAVNAEMFQTASFTSHQKEIDPIVQISAWKNKLTSEQIQNILGVVKSMGIHCYDENILPDLDLLYNIRK